MTAAEFRKHAIELKAAGFTAVSVKKGELEFFAGTESPQQSEAVSHPIGFSFEEEDEDAP